ncbi:hypothetical protein evm_003241 [Chilo suppressalis]|nr:hypothetical protein evm_003241 [Chilo suppressalis]
MNVNIAKLASSENSSPCKVESKYFASNGVMDESLSDFREKKSAVAGPKSCVNPPVNRNKAKRSSKRIKGQKDIRAALKSNSDNDLLKYTQEFDKVCKKSGLDVDTEQLLLAVALSKSLQKTDHGEPTSIQNSSSQRTGKIRTTLQEYGFTVPEIKISKKSQKTRKNYKLLLCTAAEKQQIIADKYTQVLLNVIEFKQNDHSQSDYSDKKLYFKATNIPYKEIKNNDAFYVENLLEKSSSTGNLLRNWSDIPGRPVSPTYSRNINMDFSAIECSQDELDIVLSGTLKSTKNVINKKVKSFSTDHPMITANEISKCKMLPDTIEDQSICENDGRCEEDTKNKTETQNQKCSLSVPSGNSVSSTISNITRSCSPDMFDDEATSILVDTEENKNFVYIELIDSIIEEKSKPVYFMDLTQSTDDKLSKSLKNSQNITRKNSNDLMEITECVAFSAIPKAEVINQSLREENLKVLNDDKNSINLSKPFQSDKTRRISNDFMEITECIVTKSDIKSLKTRVDLTQNSNGYHRETEMTSKHSNNCLNKSQAITAIVKLPTFEENGGNDVSLDDTIILNDDEIDSALKPSETVGQQPSNKENLDDQLSHKVCEDYINDYSIKTSQSFFDEFEVNHSDDMSEHITSVESKSPSKDDCEIDLTQSSDSATEILSTKESASNKLDMSSLGKRDEVSVDYDDLYDDIVQYSKNNTQNTSDLSQKSKAMTNERTNNSEVSSQNSNQDSVVFELCDQELNYSVNKSKSYIPWENFGGLSVMGDLPKLESSKYLEGTKEQEYNFPMENSMTESFLPDIEVKGTNKPNLKPVSNMTPENNLNKAKSVSVITPMCSNYIVKTDNVTPMLDYASMSTPQRNSELDKYGLKPFKRKRAVQLLTHLYNQTHPLVQSSTEDALSPSKKRKRCDPYPKNSVKPPKENIISTDKENNLYEVTNEVPDIKDIKCLEEDWVFQKREKSKISSCRVPLHIAFHNYVSCRSLLREAILRYEPVNIDEIHKGLVSTGYRYDPKDLLRFMDKKCITVKTVDNAARNTKRLNN